MKPTTRTPLASAGAGERSDRLAPALVRDLQQRWRQGERPRAEEYLDQHPHLWQSAEAAVEVIYEEYCLRHAAGEPGASQDILQRFPQWAPQLRVMLDCHRLLEASELPPRFPAPGDTVGDFCLQAELGRGAHGRVFLATQATLADRPVVVKITPRDGGEHLSLARLQHTNIVPLYAMVDDVAGNRRILCMPYFGRACLHLVLQELAATPLAERTGRQVVEALDRIQGTWSLSAMGAARQMLEQVSFVQAMCWITACLADALQFAHERGLVHLDLKPSNVLLAADGQPMLLDFHLARAPISAGGPITNLGGTPAYMPPEQQEAMRAFRQGRSAPTTVDGRADLYSLGLILYESLGGRLPHGDAQPLMQLNSQVSTGLADIIAKCLAPRPENRYPDAATLAEDLRRHLTDQPLAGVPNRSLRERWHKWRRRRPGAFRTLFALGLVAAALVLVGAGYHAHVAGRRVEAERALREGQDQLQHHRQFADAVRSFQRGLDLVENLPWSDRLQQQLRDHFALAQRRVMARHLQDLADELRVLPGMTNVPITQQRALLAQCRALWDKRAWIMDTLEAPAHADAARALMDIALFAADFEVKIASAGDMVAARQEGLRLLDEARISLGPSAVLEHECRAFRQALGITVLNNAPAPAPRTMWEHTALGRAYLASGDLPRAEQELTTALALAPGDRWPNFYYGLCAHRLGRHEDAVLAFSVTIGAAPDAAGCYFNRAVAQAALGRTDLALKDYDHALRLDPSLMPALQNRGLLHLAAKRWPAAIADFQQALLQGADPATMHYSLALAHQAAGSRARALEAVEQALRHNPDHEAARKLRQSLTSHPTNRAGPHQSQVRSLPGDCV